MSDSTYYEGYFKLDVYEGFGKLRNSLTGSTQLGYWKNGKIVQTGFGGRKSNSPGEKGQTHVLTSDE